MLAHAPRRLSLAALALATLRCAPDSWTYPTVSDASPDAVTNDASLDARDVTDAGDAKGDAEPPLCGDDACAKGCAQGLVALYRGDGDARDAIGAQHGTASPSVTYVEGRFGQAFDIDGSPDYVTLPPSVGNFEGDFTIALWFQSISGGELITRRPLCAFPHTFAGEDMGVTDEGVFGVEVFPVGGYFVLMSFAPAVFAGWHHAALARRGNTFELWLDGVRVDTHQAVGSFIDRTASPTFLGVGRCVRGAPGDNGTSDGRLWFHGAIDEVAFYNRALSPEEFSAWASGSCAP